MPTRFYCPSSGPVPVSPAFTTWGASGSANRFPLLTVRSNTPMGGFQGPTNATTLTQLLGQFVSAPLLPQTISGTVKGQFLCAENPDDTSSFRLACLVSKVDSSGANKTNMFAGGVLFSADGGTQPPAFASVNDTNRRLEEGSNDFALSLSPTTINDGDRLVVEIGYKDDDATNTVFGRITFGDDNASDLPENETTQTTNNPWVEFSQTILFSMRSRLYYPRKIFLPG